jgi:hypothetical protein
MPLWIFIILQGGMIGTQIEIRRLHSEIRFDSCLVLLGLVNVGNKHDPDVKIRLKRRHTLGTLRATSPGEPV